MSNTQPTSPASFLIPKPQPGEYAPYAILYIRQLPDDGQVLRNLRENLAHTLAFIRSFPADKLTTPWAPGEWTIQEILIHVADSERIFAYRALRFARQDATPLPGFEQDEYVPVSRANERAIESILAEYAAVRMATLTLFESFEEEVFARTGLASENRVSVRALAYIIAGHELHHIKSIRENYGGGE
ncbi:MAG: DinB family protein [Anaerolineales bacterium]